MPSQEEVDENLQKRNIELANKRVSKLIDEVKGEQTKFLKIYDGSFWGKIKAFFSK